MSAPLPETERSSETTTDRGDMHTTATSHSVNTSTPTRRESGGGLKLDVSELDKEHRHQQQHGHGDGYGSEGSIMGSAAGDEHAWVEALPFGLRHAVAAFYVPTLDNDRDDAVQRFRKGMITVTLLGVPAAIATIAGNYMSDAGSHDWTAAKGLAVLGPLPLFALPVLYLRMRSQRAASEGVVQAFNAVVVLFYLCMTISTPDVGWQASWVQCGIVVLLSRTRFAPFWWCVTALGMVLAIWNDATALSGNADLAATVPGTSENRRLATQLIFAIPFGLFCYVYLGILQFQLRAAEELANQSRVSTAVAQFLAQLLNGYDTERAARIIEVQRVAAERGDKLVCQPALLDAFEQLVSHLAAYRPHVPNWLIPSDASNSTDGDGDAIARPNALVRAFDAVVESGDVAHLFHYNARANQQSSHYGVDGLGDAAAEEEEEEYDADLAGSIPSYNQTEDSPPAPLPINTNVATTTPPSATQSFAANGDGGMLVESVRSPKAGSPAGAPTDMPMLVNESFSQSQSGSFAAGASITSPTAAAARRVSHASHVSGGGSIPRSPARFGQSSSPNTSQRTKARGLAGGASSKLGVSPGFGGRGAAGCRSPAAGKAGLTTVTVVVAQVAFEVVDASKLPRHVVAGAIDAVVARIFDLANQLGAAAHSFIGDVIALSWNAANRVSQPEAKAAKFLARLRADCGSDHIAVGGAAFAATSNVGMNGRGTGQRAVTIQSPWWPAFQQLFELGRDHATFVTNHTMKAQCDFAAKFRGVGGFEAADWRKQELRRVGGASIDEDAGGVDPAAVPSPLGGSDLGAYASPSMLLGARAPHNNAAAAASAVALTKIGVFEVLSEVVDTGDGEWMYLLQAQGGAGNKSFSGMSDGSVSSPKGVTSALNRAVDNWLAGRSDDAVQALDTLSAAVVPKIALQGFSTIGVLRAVLVSDFKGAASMTAGWRGLGAPDDDDHGGAEAA